MKQHILSAATKEETGPQQLLNSRTIGGGKPDILCKDVFIMDPSLLVSGQWLLVVGLARGKFLEVNNRRKTKYTQYCEFNGIYI